MPVTLLAVCARSMPYYCMFENCRCSWNRSSLRSDLKIFYFRKIFRVLLNNTRDVTRGGRGQNSPGAESLLVTKKSQQCHKHFFQNSTFASERLQVRTWGRQTCFLPQAPSNVVTPLHIAIV